MPIYIGQGSGISLLSSITEAFDLFDGSFLLVYINLTFLMIEFAVAYQIQEIFLSQNVVK